MLCCNSWSYRSQFILMTNTIDRNDIRSEVEHNYCIQDHFQDTHNELLLVIFVDDKMIFNSLSVADILLSLYFVYISCD